MRRALLLLLCWPFLVGPSSRNFDGVEDDVNMGNVLDLGTNSLTMCVWVKATEDASADFFLGKRGTSADEGYEVFQNSTDSSRFAVEDGGGDQAACTGNDIDGVWTHQCLVWTGGSDDVLTGYENATSVCTQTNTLVDSVSTTNSVKFGESSGGDDDANAVLAYGIIEIGSAYTVAQLTAVMWDPSLTPSANVDGLWPLWGDSPEVDLSEDANTGTVTGTTTSADGPPVMMGSTLPL